MATKLAPIADAHQHGHHRVRDRPAQVVGRNQNQRVGDEERGAVAELVRGREQPELVGVARRLDPPRVDDDVLGRRGEGDEERERADGREAVRRSADRQAEQAERDEDLAEEHPAAPAPEAAEERRVEPIDDRRPEELERVGQPDPREESDRLEGGSLVAQPVAERVARQQERQAGGEAQRSMTATLGWPSEAMTPRVRPLGDLMCARDDVWDARRYG